MNDERSEEVKAEVVEPEEKAGVLAIVSLITGIAGIVLGCIPAAGAFISLCAGIAAIITGVMERKKIAKGESSQKGKGMALAGLIMGIVAIVWAIVAVILLITLGAMGLFGGLFSGLSSY